MSGRNHARKLDRDPTSPPHTDAAATSRAKSLARGLFPHQVEGVAFLLRRRRAILADDMGLGKTRQAIIALHVAEPGGPYLIICPASVKRNWAREIEIALPGARVQMIAGKTDSAPLDAEWVIVNYDILSAHASRLTARRWLGVIFDEAHYVKNHQSQRSKHARAVVAAAADPVVYALTGTPLTNRPRPVSAAAAACPLTRHAARQEIPRRQQYAAGTYYELAIDDAGDVTCSCPGFEYRGMCSHARELKNAVAKGKAPPAAFVAVS